MRGSGVDSKYAVPDGRDPVDRSKDPAGDDPADEEGDRHEHEEPGDRHRPKFFEGLSAWAIGLDRERDFEVSYLDAPARIVVDIATE